MVYIVAITQMPQMVLSINDYVGYEYGDAYIYPNKAGKTVLEAIYNVTKKEKPLNA